MSSTLFHKSRPRNDRIFADLIVVCNIQNHGYKYNYDDLVYSKNESSYDFYNSLMKSDLYLVVLFN